MTNKPLKGFSTKLFHVLETHLGISSKTLRIASRELIDLIVFREDFIAFIYESSEDRIANLRQNFLSSICRPTKDMLTGMLSPSLSQACRWTQAQSVAERIVKNYWNVYTIATFYQSTLNKLYNHDKKQNKYSYNTVQGTLSVQLHFNQVRMHLTVIWK